MYVHIYIYILFFSFLLMESTETNRLEETRESTTHGCERFINLNCIYGKLFNILGKIKPPNFML